jgi:hypothetical protein
MIGESMLTVDRNSNIHVKNKEYQGTEGLWELLTLKNVNQKR